MQASPEVQQTALALLSQDTVSQLLLQESAAKQCQAAFCLLHNHAAMLFQDSKQRSAAGNFFSAAYLFAPTEMKGKVARHQALCALALHKTDR